MSEVYAEAGSTRNEVDPVPREARPFQGQAAGIVTRTAANVVDFAAVVGVLVCGYAVWSAVRFLVNPAGFSSPKPPFLAVLLCGAVVLIGYFAAAWATTGRTYGDHLLGLRVVTARGERLRWTGALVRAAFCAAFPLGLYWSVVSPTSRSVQDTVLRTSVIYDWTTRRRTQGQAGSGAPTVVPAPRSSGGPTGSG